MSLKFCIIIESNSQDYFRYCSVHQHGRVLCNFCSLLNTSNQYCRNMISQKSKACPLILILFVLYSTATITELQIRSQMCKNSWYKTTQSSISPVCNKLNAPNLYKISLQFHAHYRRSPFSLAAFLPFR